LVTILLYRLFHILWELDKKTSKETASWRRASNYALHYSDWVVEKNTSKCTVLNAA
jgi:hypothetical protein